MKELEICEGIDQMKENDEVMCVMEQVWVSKTQNNYLFNATCMAIPQHEAFFNVVFFSQARPSSDAHCTRSVFKI